MSTSFGQRIALVSAVRPREGNLKEGRNKHGNQETCKAGQEGQEARKREVSETPRFTESRSGSGAVEQEPLHDLVFGNDLANGPLP